MIDIIIKFSYNPNIKLGKGSNNTTVFEGVFGPRKVAVKRIDCENIDLGDKEAELLLLSDIHENVVKYFCTGTHLEYNRENLKIITCLEFKNKHTPIILQF